MKQSTRQTSTLSTINLNDAPVWDFFVEIRGMRLPLTPPSECVDMPDAPIPTQRELDAKSERWPGIFVWAWRVIVGGPRIKRSGIPTDGGAEYLLDVCQVILGDEHCELVAAMSTGECAQLHAAYMGCQESWLVAAQRWAFALAEKKMNPGLGLGTGLGVGSGEVANDGGSMTPVIPGGSVPIQLQPKLNGLVSADGGVGR